MIFNQVRNFDFLTTVLSVFGLVLAIIDYESQISTNLKNINIKEYPDASKHPRVTNGLSCMIRMTTLFTTVCAMGCLIMRHYHK